MEILLKDTSIPQEIKTTVATDLQYDWDPSDTEPFYKCLMTAISKFLGIHKKMEVPKVALRFNDYKGNMYVAAVVQYIPNEEPTMPGNWSYYFTFSPEDIKDAKVHEANNNGFHKVMADVVLKMMHYRFADEMWENDAIHIAIKALIDWLDTNGGEEECHVVIPEYFDASVGIEDDHKIMAIEPSAKMSQLVKGDEEIQTE